MSYKMNSAWTEYYEELDTDKRGEILKRLVAELPDDGGNAFRQRVFNYRYTDEKDPAHQIDRFLWIGCIFRDMNKNASLFSFLNKKRIAKFAKELGFDQIGELTEVEKACLLEEYKHSLKRYFDSCMTGNYHTFFGIGNPEDKTRIAAAKQDILAMTVGIAKQFRQEEYFGLWTEAGQTLLVELENK